MPLGVLARSSKERSPADSDTASFSIYNAIRAVKLEKDAVNRATIEPISPSK